MIFFADEPKPTGHRTPSPALPDSPAPPSAPIAEAPSPGAAPLPAAVGASPTFADTPAETPVAVHAEAPEVSWGDAPAEPAPGLFTGESAVPAPMPSAPVAVAPVPPTARPAPPPAQPVVPQAQPVVPEAQPVGPQAQPVSAERPAPPATPVRPAAPVAPAMPVTAAAPTPVAAEAPFAAAVPVAVEAPAAVEVPAATAPVVATAPAAPAAPAASAPIPTGVPTRAEEPAATRPVASSPIDPVPAATVPAAPAPAAPPTPAVPETRSAPAAVEPVTDTRPPEAAPAEPPRPVEEPPAAPALAPNGAGAVIKVIGVGGGGGNAVNRMIEAGVRGVEFIAANTDLQVLERSLAPVKVPLGVDRTGGLGCGGDPEIGRAAARDDMDRLIAALGGADMIFLTVGEGGGTGTGAAPVVACVAQEIRALCVAVVTRPLGVEGRRRRETADDGIRELREYVDTLISVPNDRVVEVFGNLPMRAAFREADDVVRQAVQGISDLIQTPGEINLDFADVRAAMRARGDAVMGIGLASGENRVEEATRAAISSPLLEDTSIRGASSIILNVSGGEDLTLNEISRAAEVVREAVLPEGPALRSGAAEPGDYILLGTALDPSLAAAEGGPAIRVTVVATGFPERSRAGATPQDFFAYTRRTAPAAGEPSPGGERRSGWTGPDRAPSRGTAAVEPPTPVPFPAGAGTEEFVQVPAAPAPLGAAEARMSAAEAPGDAPTGGNPPPGDPSAAEPSDGPIPDAPPAFDPAAAGDDRWGDLDTPAWSRGGNDAVSSELAGRRPTAHASGWSPNRHDR